MQAGAVPYAIICLRCQARRSLRLQPRQNLPNSFQTALRSPNHSAAADGQVTSEALPALPSPRASHHPLKRLRGHRNKAVRESSASIDTPFLGSPSEVVLLRDANISFPKPKAESDPSEDQKQPAVDLLQSFIEGTGLRTFAEVSSNIDNLRPTSNDSVISKQEFNVLQETLREGFTTSQLAEYIDRFRAARAKIAGTDTVKESTTPLRADVLEATEWKLGVTPFGKSRPESPEPTITETIARKGQLVQQLLIDCWGVQISEEHENLGEIDVKLPPLELSFLINKSK